MKPKVSKKPSKRTSSTARQSSAPSKIKSIWKNVWNLPNFLILSISLLISAYMLWSDKRVHVTATSMVSPGKSWSVPCSDDYKQHPVFPGCTPTKKCGRGVQDGLVSIDEVRALKRLLTKGMAHGGSNGGASILDLHSGALSKADKFVDIYRYLTQDKLAKIFTESDVNVYRAVKDRIRDAIADAYGLDVRNLHLTKPTFFSRMTSVPAETQHDEYWHSHIDKIQYGSFDYTSLLYLSNFGSDFQGGRFIFDKDDAVIEPAAGRVSFFTSGSENPHHVEKVTGGTRLALTVAFTCDQSKAISDPQPIAFNNFSTAQTGIFQES